MTVEQGIAFLEALRAKQIRVKDSGWIEASCVLAPWTHKNHADHTPSFGLRVVPGERTFFSCFACRSGSAEELLQVLELYARHGPYDFARCHQLLSDDEQTVVALPEYQEFGQPGPVFIEWPQYWLDSFKLAEWVPEASTYLAGRGVAKDTVMQFDLRWDSKRQMVVAPYRDVYGRLAGARGRSIVVGEGSHKHFDYTYQNVNNARLCWYYEQSLNLPGPVVVVEGQFDVMRVAQVFPKVVGALSAKPTWEKMKKLSESPCVIQIPDRDEAGQLSVQRYREMCGKLSIPYQYIWLDEGVKDPDDAHPEYLRDRIHAML